MKTVRSLSLVCMRLLPFPPQGVVSFLEKSEATRLFSLIYGKIRILIASYQFLIGQSIALEECSCVASPIFLEKKQDVYQLGKNLGFGAGLGGLS